MSQMPDIGTVAGKAFDVVWWQGSQALHTELYRRVAPSTIPDDQQTFVEAIADHAVKIQYQWGLFVHRRSLLARTPHKAIPTVSACRWRSRVSTAFMKASTQA